MRLLLCVAVHTASRPPPPALTGACPAADPPLHVSLRGRLIWGNVLGGPGCDEGRPASWEFQGESLQALGGSCLPGALLRRSRHAEACALHGTRVGVKAESRWSRCPAGCQVEAWEAACAGEAVGEGGRRLAGPAAGSAHDVSPRSTWHSGSALGGGRGGVRLGASLGPAPCTEAHAAPPRAPWAGRAHRSAASPSSWRRRTGAGSGFCPSRSSALSKQTAASGSSGRRPDEKCFGSADLFLGVSVPCARL